MTYSVEKPIVRENAATSTLSASNVIDEATENEMRNPIPKALMIRLFPGVYLYLILVIQLQLKEILEIFLSFLILRVNVSIADGGNAF